MWDLFDNKVGLWPYFQRQTHHGFPSTSVSVRCFFKSACLTSISLSSGVMVSRLEKETQTAVSASFNGVVFILTCCGEPHVSLDSCVRHCATKKHLLPSSDRPKKKKTKQKNHCCLFLILLSGNLQFVGDTDLPWIKGVKRQQMKENHRTLLFYRGSFIRKNDKAEVSGYWRLLLPL